MKWYLNAQLEEQTHFCKSIIFFVFLNIAIYIAHQIILCETKFRYVIDSNEFAIFIDS